jgi:mannobiose 2-epimerase
MYADLKSDLDKELKSILAFWSENAIDHNHGGFLGERDFYNKAIKNAPKGIILNTRILWTFSASSNHLRTEKYKEICDRAYNYLKTHFKDKNNNGVFWILDYKGKPIDKRKQIYAQAFAIYALSEYFKLSKDMDAKIWAIELFFSIEKQAKDFEHKGYFEAFTENWSPIEDMRLSEKDLNASKTMNTHLHILEAYTSLLKIYDHEYLKFALENLVNLMFDKFLNEEYNFELFFDDKWKLLSRTISFGHDIEAAWLILDAAKTLENKKLIKTAEDYAIKIAEQFLKTALNKDGAVMNEKNRQTAEIDTDLHWWPQVEALIGLDYVYKITENEKYLLASEKIWAFTRKHIKDHINGEWHFRVDANYEPYTTESKVSMWKAPYHNTRACLILNQ